MSTWIVSILAMAPSAFAGKVALTTYYPSPHGEYQNLSSTQDYNFATTSGRVGIGTAASQAKLDISSTASAFLPPRLTTAERDSGAFDTKIAGMVIYNTDAGQLEVWDGSSLNGAGSGGIVNSQVGTGIKYAYRNNAGNWAGDPVICDNSLPAGSSEFNLWFTSRPEIRVPRGKTYTLIATAYVHYQWASGNGEHGDGERWMHIKIDVGNDSYVINLASRQLAHDCANLPVSVTMIQQLRGPLPSDNEADTS